jgi:hypothetical protein
MNDYSPVPCTTCGALSDEPCIGLRTGYVHGPRLVAEIAYEAKRPVIREPEPVPDTSARIDRLPLKIAPPAVPQ